MLGFCAKHDGRHGLDSGGPSLSPQVIPSIFYGGVQVFLKIHRTASFSIFFTRNPVL